MSIQFPTALDSLTNPASTDKVSVVDHASQHSNANDAIEALEAKVGINSSAVTTSHDYKLSEITSSDKAVGKTATQTLTNKTIQGATLTSAIITDTASNVMAKSLKSATTTVDVSAATAPTSGQVLMATDSTHATWQSPATSPVITSCIPSPMVVSAVGGTLPTNSNTTAHYGMITVPFNITVNKVSFYVNGKSVNGTVKVGLYSADGQTQLFNFTTATISATGLVTTALGTPVSLTAGNYYVVFLSVSTTDISTTTYATNTTQSINLLAGTVSSSPIYEGTSTVTADTLPATFTPSSTITSASTNTLAVRFD